MRPRLYSFITNNPIYNIVNILFILLSLIPLAFKSSTPIFQLLDYLTVSLFLLDYILRFLTADLYLHKSYFSFLIYPFTFFSLIDLLSILPTFLAISASFKLLKLLRLFRCLRVFKLFRYSKSFERGEKGESVISNSRHSCSCVCADLG